MKKIIILFCFILTCSICFSQWQFVGGNVTSGFSRYQSLAFNPSTYEPYLAFMDGTNAPASVKKFNGSSWVNVGPAMFTGVFSGYISLDFNPISSEPYMIFSDNGNSDKATVMKYNGSNWVIVGSAGFSTTATSYNTIKFNPVNKKAYVAFAGTSSKCTVMMFNDTTWVNVGIDGFSSGQIAGQIGLDFDPLTGDPYVLFTDMANGQVATCMMYNGLNWTNVGPVGFSPGLASNVSLAFNPITNEPYAAFSDVSNNGASVMKFDGANWITVGTPAFSPGTASDNHIGFQPVTNELVIVFRDWLNGNETDVMKYDGANWITVGAAVDAGSNDFRNLAFHPITHEIYVAYQANNTANNVSRVKKFPECIIDTNVTTSNDTLSANQNGASYQWLDCNNNDSAIIGETNQQFIASVSGDYAVEITLGSCVDTSACTNILVTQITPFAATDYKIYPNPVNNMLNIDMGTITSSTNLSLISIDGKVVYQKNNIKDKRIIIDMSKVNKGIYFLRVKNDTIFKTFKIIRQ